MRPFELKETPQSNLRGVPCERADCIPKDFRGRKVFRRVLFTMTERGHPVRLSAQREQPLKVILFVSLSVLRPLADKMSALQVLTPSSRAVL
jgi:hypothetical protein